MFSLDNLEVAHCSGNTALAKMVATEMLLKTDPVLEKTSADDSTRIFKDGELRPHYHEQSSLRGKHLMLMQSFAPRVDFNDLGINDQLIELFIAIRAAKLASVSEVTAVLPYLPYARSDKKDLPKVAIASKLVLDLLKVSGADRVVVVDPHKDQIAGFFDGPFDIIYSSELFLPLIRKNFNLQDLVLIAADGGGEKMVRAWAKRLLGHSNIGLIGKSRDVGSANSTSHSYHGPSLEGKIALFPDDLIASAGTMIGASNLVSSLGAKEVHCIAPHALFLDDNEGANALNRIRKSAIDKVWVTNTIQQREEVFNTEVTGGKIVVYNIARLLATKMIKVHTGQTMGID